MGLLKENKKNNVESSGIGAMMIIEAVGKPPEYLIETLEDIITKIDNEKGVRVISKDIKEPQLMKDQKNFYTTFAEIEIEVEEIIQLGVIIVKYMPAHVEIIYPELIALTNNGWNDIFNEILMRLHGYDEVARIVQVEKKILEDKLREVLKERGLGKKGDEGENI